MKMNTEEFSIFKNGLFRLLEFHKNNIGGIPESFIKQRMTSKLGKKTSVHYVKKALTELQDEKKIHREKWGWKVGAPKEEIDFVNLTGEILQILTGDEVLTLSPSDIEKPSIEKEVAHHINGVPVLARKRTGIWPREQYKTVYIADMETALWAANLGRTDFLCPGEVVSVHNEGAVNTVKVIKNLYTPSKI